MNKKIIVGLAITIISTVLLSSCGGNGDTTTTTTSTNTYPTEPLILYSNAPATYEELPKVTPAELKGLLDSDEDVVVVDVNPLSMYNTGHIPGAVHRPWSFKGFSEDPDLPKSVLLVFYCVCEHEEDSGLMALSAVTKYGYRNIKLLQGGTPAWEDAGYPMENSK
jgi:rhodanese-related sulfurtransferase